MFPDVFLMDCTYKTNRYRLPLLSIVGQTSTNLTFFAAFSFISNETEGSYKWALECFKSMLEPSSLPNVLIVDREMALMKAIKVVFPHVRIILCQVHINRNIIAHCKKYFKRGKECEAFLSEWQVMVYSPTVHDFNMRLNDMLTKYSERYPDVLNYVLTTWVEPYKEYFVSAWIDQLLHFGNSTTNRVESSHSQLKKFLEVSICSLSSIWKTFHQMLNLQHTQIRHSFGQSSIQVNTGYRGSLYTNLLGHVSVFALEAIKKEETNVKSGHALDTTVCTHKMRYTMGLPCGHELVPYMQQSTAYPLWMIHKHWRQLTLQPCKSDDAKVKEESDPYEVIQVDLDGFLQKYNNISDIQRNEMKRKLREIMEPTTTQTKEPLLPLRLKGRPIGSKKKCKDEYKSTKRELSLFEHVLLGEVKVKDKPKKLIPRRNSNHKRFLKSIIDDMPSFITNHVIDAINVLGDGHCGYRVVSQALQMGDNWLQVRQDLLQEMKKNEDKYNDIYGIVRVKELLASLDCTMSPAPIDKWMTMPDMGLVISSCYNVMVVHISKFQSFTFLPLHSAPTTVKKTIYIGFVNNNHYIQLIVQKDCPLPPVISLWMTYHSEIAAEWNLSFEGQDNEIVNLTDP